MAEPEKGCPFCSGDDDTESLEVIDAELGKSTKYYIRCNKCETTGPMANSEEDAVSFWDDRPVNSVFGIVSPKLDNIRESISEIEDKLTEIENAVED